MDTAKWHRRVRDTALVCWLSIITLFASAGTVSAQRPGGLQPPSNEHLAMMRMWRLISVLEIDEAQATKVFPLLSQHQRERQALVARHQKLRAQLRQQLEQESPDDVLLAQIQQIRAADEEMTKLQSGLSKRLEDVLTPRQQALLTLFEDSFRADLKDMVRRMRGMGGVVDGDRPSRRSWGGEGQ